MENRLGYRKIHLTDEDCQKIYDVNNTDLDEFHFLENEYIIIEDENKKPIDLFCYQNGKLRRIHDESISNMSLGEIRPRNLQQKLAFDLLQDRQTKVKLIRGVYGSGKDFIMLSKALQLIERGVFDKIVFVRPNISVANLPDIGALPGTADEKLAWTLGPIFDKVGGQAGLDMLISNGRIEPVPLLYIRGRSFENSIVYVTEGQNMTTEIVKLILGRIGEGSELWLNGDNHQTDKKIFDKDNGIARMIDKLSGNPLFGYVYLPITERSDVANLANLLDED